VTKQLVKTREIESEELYISFLILFLSSQDVVVIVW